MTIWSGVSEEHDTSMFRIADKASSFLANVHSILPKYMASHT